MQKLFHTTSVDVILITLILGCNSGSFSERNYSVGAKAEKNGPSTAVGDSIKRPASNLNPKLITNGIVDAASLEKKCASAQNLFEKQIDIEFPAQQECNWETEGNLARRDGYLQAINTQVQNLQLNQDSVLCDLEIATSVDETVHYDDFLFLTMSDSLILSSNGAATKFLNKKENIYQWNIKQILGKPIHRFESGAYCIEGSTHCEITGHDKAGAIHFALGSQSLAPLSFAVFDKKSVPISLHITGDNDDGDCFHSGLNFKANLTFLPIDLR